MREKPERRFRRERQRATILTLIFCTSTAVADQTKLPDSAKPSPNVQRVEPSEIGLKAGSVDTLDEAKTLQYPPLPLLSSQQRDERVHPFLKSSQSSESNVRLTSGLADFIRGASAEEQFKENSTRDQKVTLVTPLDMSASVARTEVPPTPARRLAEPIFANKGESANGTDEISFADLIRGKAQSDGNSSQIAPEKIAGKEIKADLDAAAESKHETQPTNQRTSTTLEASLASTPIRTKSPASIVSTLPKIQNVLPLPTSTEEVSDQATLDEPSHEKNPQPILFSLTDQLSPSETPDQEKSPSQKASSGSNGITFSLSDRGRQPATVLGSPSKTKQYLSVIAAQPTEAKTAAEDGEQIKQQPFNAEPGIVASPVILRRSVITLTQVPKVSRMDGSEPSSKMATGLLEQPSPITDSNTEEPDTVLSNEEKEAVQNRAMGEEEQLDEAATPEQPNAELETKESAAAEVNEVHRDSTPALDNASEADSSLDSPTALVAPVSETTLP